MISLDCKLERLRARLRELGSLCIGYSGGVDSVFLAVTAVDELGSGAVLAVTGLGPAYPEVQRDTARECARRFGIPHLEVETREMEEEGYVSNPVDRCYHCKTELWGRLASIARERGLEAVASGANADDRGDYRPGMTAAREHGVVSPLLEAGLGKDDIRRLSRVRGLPTWDRPASPCLASRIPHGLPVTAARLREVERVEAVLRERGYREFRARHHGDAIRLEFAPAELEQALRRTDELTDSVAAVTPRRLLVDVEGYRRGSLHEGLALVQLEAS